VLININKRKLEEEMYVAPILGRKNNKKNNKLSKTKYSRPAYLKGCHFDVLQEIPCTDSYIIEVIGKDFVGRKLVSKDQVLGYKRIIWDGVIIEEELLKSLKEKKTEKKKK
jgi:hypothetical protein